jgi:hypothetical protein
MAYGASVEQYRRSVSAQISAGPSRRALAVMFALDLVGVAGVASGLLSVAWAFLCPAALVAGFALYTCASPALRLIVTSRKGG